MKILGRSLEQIVDVSREMTIWCSQFRRVPTDRPQAETSQAVTHLMQNCQDIFTHFLILCPSF